MAAKTVTVTLEIDERILSDIGNFQKMYLFNNRSLAVSWLLMWALNQKSRYEVALRASGPDELTENDLRVSFQLTEQQKTKEGEPE